MYNKRKMILIGIITGLANGIFGGGGGLILIPLLINYLKLDGKKAFATSISIIFPICVSSSIIYMLYNEINFNMVLPFIVGGLLGGFMAGKFFRKIPTKALNVSFSLFIIYGGIRLALMPI